MKQTLTKTRLSMTLLVVCFVLMLGIVFASPTNTVYAAGEDGTAPTIVKTGGNDVDRVNLMSNLPAAIAGKPYKAADGSNYKIEVTGTAPVTFSIPLSHLPEGLSLNETTGEIVGTPTKAGNYTVTIYVENAYGSDNVLVSLKVYDEESKPKIKTPAGALPDGYVDSSYWQKIDYVEGTGYTPEASIIGNFPYGLKILCQGSIAQIYGTPEKADTFTFTVRVENAFGFDEKQYTITIQKGYQKPKIINQNDITNKPAIKGKYFEFQFEATGTNAADNPFLFFTYLNQFEESTPNAQGEYELGNGLFLTKEGKVYGTPYSTEDISFNVGVKTKNLNGDYEETGFGTGNCYVPVYENGQITGVTISPENTSVPKGGQRQFTATVIGYGDFDKSVTWERYGSCSSAGTSLSQDGVLTVGIDETATIIGVRAISKGDTGYSLDIPVKIIDHTHTTTLVPEVPKTCTTDGNKKHFKCNVCGDLFAEAGAVNQLTEGQVKTPAGHEYGDLVPKQEPTCKQTGMQAHYKCSVCNKYFDESKTEKTVAELTIPIDPNAHDFGAWTAEVPATCVATGTKGHKDCNRCNKHYDESGNEITDLTIPTNDNHDWNDWVSNGNGTHTRTCKRDSGHKENGTCSGGTATCTEQATCEKCNAKYGGTLGHNYGEVTYTWMSDNTCKAERVCAHDNTHVESEKVTATAEEIKAATCKEKGKMKYTATFTNKAFAAQVKEVDIDFVEHIYGDLIPEVPATADKTGTKKHYKCSVCGKLFDENKNEVTAADLVIPKIGTHNVVINGESNFYAHGESVTVTAEDKEGKEFVGWQDASGKIVSTQKEYTFVVKDGMVLTAVYQDKAPGGGTIDGEIAPAPDKNGLSGGQIAGIVIGSLAGVGIVGFAIFWFVVKKKSFADLIAAIKALFNKKQ